MALLEIKNFKKSFDNIEVLKGIDLEVEKGQVVSIIGSSGSGKTTLLRCINFLETPNSGEMILDGESLINETSKDDSDAVLREKRLNFGLVFQSFNLFPQYSVLKNITLAPTLLLKDKITAYKKELKTDKSLSRSARKLALNDFKQKEKVAIEQEAFELLEKQGYRNLKLRIIGNFETEYGKEVKEYIKAHDLENIEIVPAV
jgi:ABC-type histidine transport system ATPase subunit